MNVFHAVSFGVFAAATVLTPSTAQATSLARERVQMAAGVCQPFVPTNQIRFNASGMTNAGSSLVYAVCSALGAAEPSIEGSASGISILITNNSSSAQTVSCTGRPGSPEGTSGGQLAAPFSKPIPAGSSGYIAWNANDFDGPIGNANFTCALYPGLTISHVRVKYTEEVGA